MKINKFIILIAYTAFTISGLWGQKSPVYQKYKTQYPDSWRVRLTDENKVDISIKDGGILIEREVIEEDLYLKTTATFGSKRAVNFSSFYELESIEASSLEYREGKYRETKVKDFTEKDEMRSVFYDDTKSINFIYPNLKIGSKSKLRYTEKIKNPRFLNSFYFADYHPIANCRVTITTDKKIHLDFKEFNTEGYDIRFSKSEKRGKHIYTWEAQEIEEFKSEPGAPDLRKTFPHIIPIITKYEIDGKTITLSENVSDLYQWYYSLIKDVNTETPSKELKVIVSDLINDKKNDLEKVKAIYYWVQENIKYIAFEYALGGFVPRKANDVYSKKYGDCKDNSSILFKMLEIAGLHGNITWIGTRSIPYKYSEVPTPVTDNHMILSYTDEENTYYLDATGRYIPISLPSSFIQGKEALISVDEKEFLIKEVPIIPAKKNKIKDSISIKIKEQDIIGSGVYSLSGYPKIDFFNVLEGKKKEESNELYNYELRKGNNSFLIDSFNEENKYHYEKDFLVSYSFNIKDYLHKLADETYINLNLNRSLSNLKSKKDRKNNREFRYKNSIKEITVLEIPDDKIITYIPENFQVANDFFSCAISYRTKNKTIHYTLTATMDFMELTPNQQIELNDLIKKIEKSFKEVIILKDKKI